MCAWVHDFFFSLSLSAASVELFIFVLQSLYVNLLKSNIVVFRNGGQRKQWYYDSKDVKLVNAYKYLRLILSTCCVFVYTTIERPSK